MSPSFRKGTAAKPPFIIHTSEKMHLLTSLCDHICTTTQRKRMSFINIICLDPQWPTLVIWRSSGEIQACLIGIIDSPVALEMCKRN